MAELAMNLAQFALPAGGIGSIATAMVTRGKMRRDAEDRMTQREIAAREAFAKEQAGFRAGLTTRIDQLERLLTTSEDRCAAQMQAQAAEYKATIAEHEARSLRDRHQIGNMRTAMKMVCLIPGMPETKVTEIIREVQDLMERSDAEERLAA